MINSLDDAITHCLEVAEEQDKLATRYEDASGYSRTHIESLKTNESIKCRECAEEHRQLVEWLTELKKYRAIFEKVGKILADNGYTIDDLDTIFGKVNGEVNTDDTNRCEN